MEAKDVIELPESARDYLPGDPIRALFRVWECEDVDRLINAEMMNWFYIALTTENAITDFGDVDFLTTQKEFIGFFSGLLPLIEASFCFYVGTRFYFGGADIRQMKEAAGMVVGKWPDNDEIRHIIHVKMKTSCPKLAFAEVQNPMLVMRRFWGQHEIGPASKWLWKFFQALEGYDGPFRKDMAIASSSIYENVLGILEATYELAQRCPEGMEPAQMMAGVYKAV